MTLAELILPIAEVGVVLVIVLAGGFIGLFAWLHHEQERAHWDRWVR